MQGWRWLSAPVLAGLLTACTSGLPGAGPSSPSSTPRPFNAVAAGVAPASIAHPKDLRGVAGAFVSFAESCPVLIKRTDTSGLTTPADWTPICAALPDYVSGKEEEFFATFFTPVRIATGDAQATGYYEPTIAGVRKRQPGYDVPVYGMPDDLVRAWPDDVPQNQRDGTPPLSRKDASGVVTRFYDRAAIEDGALAGRGLEIGWAQDAVELFFLQIQGSGRLLAPNGEEIAIGYAGQNGHGYTAIGAVMRERGLLGDAEGQYAPSMQGIMAYLREHPEDGKALMRENKSWVFFRELTGDGPLGAMGVPVRPQSSVAVDPMFVPLGAPVVLNFGETPVSGVWIAQDTGGAIKGANRFDTFWGHSSAAREFAGALNAKGTAVVLLPKQAARRVLGQ